MVIRTAQWLPHLLLKGSTGPEALRVGPFPPVLRSIHPFQLRLALPFPAIAMRQPAPCPSPSSSSRTRLDSIESRCGGMRMHFIPEGDENGSNIGFSQIHPTCLASSSVKVLARLAMPAHLVTISDRRQRTSANTLPRYDKHSVYLRSSFLGSSIDSCTIIEKVILTRGDTR